MLGKATMLYFHCMVPSHATHDRGLIAGIEDAETYSLQEDQGC